MFKKIGEYHEKGGDATCLFHYRADDRLRVRGTKYIRMVINLNVVDTRFVFSFVAICYVRDITSHGFQTTR